MDAIEMQDNICHVKYLFQTALDQYTKLQGQHASNLDGISVREPSGENDNIQFNNVTVEVQKNDEKIEIKSLPNSCSEGDSNFERSVKLPQIKLPFFDGDVDDWLEYRDSFIDMVINNTAISDVKRYHYLIGSLGDKAKKTIKNIEFTSKGFHLAWESLMFKYNDEREILENHLHKFFNLKSISGESRSGISRLLDDSQTHVRGLEKLGEKLSDAVIVFTVKQRFDQETRKLWENEHTSDVQATWQEMVIFMHKRCRALKPFKETNNISRKTLQNSFVASIDNRAPNNYSCLLCGKSHFITNCAEFLAMTPKQRMEKSRKLGLCQNCLKSRHKRFTCKIKERCTNCNGRHNGLVHVDEFKKPSPNESRNLKQEGDENNKDKSVYLCNGNGNQSQVLLSTAVVLISDNNGNFHSCRALLDSASQSNFISAEVATKWFYQFKSEDASIAGINNTKTNIRHKINASIKSLSSQFVDLEFLVVSQVANRIPHTFINTDNWRIPKSFKLADSTFNVPGMIDLLLGAEVFYKIILQDQYQISKDTPTLVNTRFGWIVGGKVEESYNFFMSTELALIEENKIDDLIQKFWEIESCDNKKPMSLEERNCEELYETSYRRDNDGRYIVKLPFREPIQMLGDSKMVACKRLQYLEKKLNNNSDLKASYINFMREYIDLGHMKLCQSNSQSGPVDYFLPHHAVCKPASTSTKLRVVFDASAKTSTNLNLNDILMVGPVVQQELFSIIFRFRKFVYAFTTDVEKIYLQIKICDDHTPYQKRLWR